MVREENYDVVIVGCGVGGLYTALNLPSEDRILMIFLCQAAEWQ